MKDDCVEIEMSESFVFHKNDGNKYKSKDIGGMMLVTSGTGPVAAVGGVYMTYDTYEHLFLNDLKLTAMLAKRFGKYDGLFGDANIFVV